MRIEQLERNNAKLERDLAERTEERDHWKHHSEHLEKQLAAAQRAGRRQAAPFAKDRRQGRGGDAAGGRRGDEAARRTGSTDTAGSRHPLTKRTRRRCRARAPIAAVRSS